MVSDDLSMFANSVAIALVTLVRREAFRNRPFAFLGRLTILGEDDQPRVGQRSWGLY